MMCNLSQGILEEGIQRGRKETLAEAEAKIQAERDKARAELQAERETHNLTTIQAISASLGVPYEKAMDILKITDQAERQRYLDQLTH